MILVHHNGMKMLTVTSIINPTDTVSADNTISGLTLFNLHFTCEL